MGLLPPLRTPDCREESATFHGLITIGFLSVGLRPDFVSVLCMVYGVFQEDKRRSWRRPITGMLEKFREGQDNRRKRRNVTVELESSSSGVPGSDGSDGRKTGRRKTRRSGGGGGAEERSAGKVPGVFASQIEATRGSRVNEENQNQREGGGKEGDKAKEKRSRGKRKAKASKLTRDSASKGKTGEEGTTAKKKGRALQAFWGRLIGKLRGGKGSSSEGTAGAGGEAEMRRLRMLKELKGLVEERHGRELWGRAKEARHELDDALLMR